MKRLFLFLALSVLLFSLGCAEEAAPSVMDKDGDGKVSTEEFLEHAQKQVGRRRAGEDWESDRRLAAGCRREQRRDVYRRDLLWASPWRSRGSRWRGGSR
eukprot:765145-Hanusia_phi.AAC.3